MGKERIDEMKLRNNLPSFCTTQIPKELCKGVNEKELKRSLEGKKAD
jgi:hypothetical protein